MSALNPEKTKSTDIKSKRPSFGTPSPLLYSVREFWKNGAILPSLRQKLLPPPSFLVREAVPRLPSTEGNLGRLSQFALHRGQTGTFWPEEGILGRFRRASQGALLYYLRFQRSFPKKNLVVSRDNR